MSGGPGGLEVVEDAVGLVGQAEHVGEPDLVGGGDRLAGKAQHQIAHEGVPDGPRRRRVQGLVQIDAADAGADAALR